MSRFFYRDTMSGELGKPMIDPRFEQRGVQLTSDTQPLDEGPHQGGGGERVITLTTAKATLVLTRLLAPESSVRPEKGF